MRPEKTDKLLNRKERERLARRKEILNSALRLFSQKGYHQTSMSEIARASEFSIGSLYNFFKSKEELFFVLFKEEIEEIERRVQTEIAKKGSVKEKLTALLETLFSYFEEHWEAFVVLALNRQSFEAGLKDNLFQILHLKHLQFVKTMKEIIEQGIKERELKELKPEEMASALIGLVNGSIFLWLESGRSYSLKERIPELLEIFYRGVEK